MKNTQTRQHVLLGSLIALALALHHPSPATAKSLADFKPSGTAPDPSNMPTGTPNPPPAPPPGIAQNSPPTRYVPEKPVKTIIGPEAILGEIIVKFDESAVVRLRNNQLTSPSHDLAEVNKILAKARAKIQRLASESEETADKRRNSIQGDGGLTAADMNSYYLVTLDSKDSVSQAALIDALNAFPVVTIAYTPGKASPADIGTGLAPVAVSGPIVAQTISVGMTPSGNDQGKQGSIFVVAILPPNLGGKVFFMSSASAWTLFASCETAPAYFSGNLKKFSNIPLVSTPTDLSTLKATQIYVGYGVGDAVLAAGAVCGNMLQFGTYSMIYTVF